MSRPSLYFLALLVLAADQLTKHWVLLTHGFWPSDSREIIPGFFALTFCTNTGGAFSILPHGTLLLAAAAAVAAVAIVVYTLRHRHPLPVILAVALALPLGGALGNLLDRIRLGHVVDFLDLHIGLHQWPVFNVADSAICIGVVLLAFYSSRQPVPAQEKFSAAVLKE